MKKRIFLTFTLLAALALGGCSSTGTQTAQDTDGSVQQDTAQTETQAQAEGIGTHHAEITIAGKGTISVELDGDAAPITVQNFMDLAESGLRRADLPPHHQRLYDAGGRPERGRYRRLGSDHHR